MPRLIVILSFTTLCLFASCVDLSKPARVSRCEQDNTCGDGKGGATGGKGGATAGSGGSTGLSADAGVSDAPAGGQGGESGRTGGAGGSGGAGGTGGDASGTAGQGGSEGSGTGGSATGGTIGGSSGSVDAGTNPAPDAEVDTPLGDPDVPFDTKTKLDGTPDTRPGPEASRPEPAPEPGPDAPRDVSPDSTPDRPDTAFDAPTCIQTFKSNSYSVSVPSDAEVNGCSECKENGFSQEAQCKSMVDCLVTSWVCKTTASCWMDCLHVANGDSVLEGCVKTLVTRACPGW